MRSLNFDEMKDINGGISDGCGWALVGLGLSLAGVVVASAVAITVTAGVAAPLVGSAVGSYLGSILGVGISCS